MGGVQRQKAFFIGNFESSGLKEVEVPPGQGRFISYDV